MLLLLLLFLFLFLFLLLGVCLRHMCGLGLARCATRSSVHWQLGCRPTLAVGMCSHLRRCRGPWLSNQLLAMCLCDVHSQQLLHKGFARHIAERLNQEAWQHWPLPSQCLDRREA